MTELDLKLGLEQRIRHRAMHHQLAADLEETKEMLLALSRLRAQVALLERDACDVLFIADRWGEAVRSMGRLREERDAARAELTRAEQTVVASDHEVFRLTTELARLRPAVTACGAVFEGLAEARLSNEDRYDIVLSLDKTQFDEALAAMAMLSEPGRPK